MKIITSMLIQSFKNYLREEEKSKSTIEKYIRDITALMVWLGGRETDKTAVLEYKEKIRTEYAARSVNSIISSMNSFFDFVGWKDCKVKLLKIQKQIFADESKELKKEECERLLKVAKDSKNERLYYLMRTICATGIRVSELRFITVEAVGLRQARIPAIYYPVLFYISYRIKSRYRLFGYSRNHMLKKSAYNRITVNIHSHSVSKHNSPDMMCSQSIIQSIL